MVIYGKLINNILTFAPHRLIIDGCVVFNPTDAQYEAAGYSPVIYAPKPEARDGYYAESHWEEQGDSIVEVWKVVSSSEPTEDEALTRYSNELTGKNDPDIVRATETLITKLTEE